MGEPVSFHEYKLSAMSEAAEKANLRLDKNPDGDGFMVLDPIAGAAVFGFKDGGNGKLIPYSATLNEAVAFIKNQLANPGKYSRPLY